MEFIAEFICEVILQGIFDVTIENPKVHTRVKTVIFTIFTQLITAGFVWLTVSARRANNDGWIICGILSVAWGIGMLIAAIYGHRKGWPKNDV